LEIAKLKRQFQRGSKIKICYETTPERQSALNFGTGVASHGFRVNIIKYAALNSRQSAERHAARCLDFVAKDEGSFERSREKLLLRVGSLLGRMKLEFSSRIEANVPKARPLIGIATSHTLLMERTFFLERLQQALA
jgi:hypothetical protein